ncbi:glutamate racemase [Cricetibacter osteomyelitidis]|uniref:Glutamate racemase n=1 Tax=Cricetibacter osteomyelitidis TaxID=1521931 RepID=A0A4R2SJU3_9PAST|nr:glutamate racemase [Cricetibacter osteomyelitidis]TCP90117.1 glutamate racemase [Cricetibacter osteomyelitidis]
MKPTILVFDSGMGGLSVYREIKAMLPNAHYLYCFDNAFFPYSEKEEQEIIDRTLSICTRINGQYPIDIIVIGCNTASTVVLPALRSAFDCPIVGTVPAVKPAAAISQTKTIGLLATKGTVKRSYVNDLINNYAADCIVERIGSTKLPEIAEQKIYGNSVDLLALQNEVAPWIGNKELDTVILGCTHFPLLKEELRLCLPQVKYFVDPAKAIAKRVKSLLNEQKVRSKNEKFRNLIFCTRHFEEEQRFQHVLKYWGFDELILRELN